MTLRNQHAARLLKLNLIFQGHEPVPDTDP